MKLGSFLNLDEEGFHIGKISAPDIRPEDVLGYLKSRGISPIIYIPDYVARYVALPAIAYSLLNHLDGDFFLGLGGIFGTVFQSLLPAEDIPGQYDVYPDIDENVVFYVLAKAMDYVAEKYEKPIIWIFGRVDFAHDYVYVRFIKFLQQHYSLGQNVHKCLVVGEASDSLPLEELSIEDEPIKPQYRFQDIISKPFTDDHKKVLGVLALVGSHSSAHITSCFMDRFFNEFPFARKIFDDLMKWQIIERYNDHFYAFTSYRFYRYVLDHWVDSEAELMALNLMRRSREGNMKFVAYMADKDGNIKKALGAITLHALQLIKSSRHRKAYMGILPLYKKYKEYLSDSKLQFYVYLAASFDRHDTKLTSYVVDKLVNGGNIRATTYIPLAIITRGKKQYREFWEKVYREVDKVKSPFKRQMMLIAYFEYMWHTHQMTTEKAKKIYKSINCETAVGDPFLTVLMLSTCGRMALAVSNFSDALQVLNKAKDIISDKMLWFHAASIFNNLFVALYRSETSYPYMRYLPLLFVSSQSAMLYASSKVDISLANYLLISTHSSRPFSYLNRIFGEFKQLLDIVYEDKTLISQLYYAMSFVYVEYGYSKLAFDAIEHIKDIVEGEDHDSMYKVIFNYYHAKAHAFLMEGNEEKAMEVVKEFESKFGLYGDAGYKFSIIYEGIEMMRGRKPPVLEVPLYVYRYYLANKDIDRGIEALMESFHKLRKVGDLLSMAQAKKYMAYLYEYKGDVASMQEALYDAVSMLYILESAEVSSLAEKALINPSVFPIEMLRLYINRMILIDVLADITMENNVMGAMETVLSNIVIPASGLWMYFSWEHFSEFVGFTVTKGFTQKFREFYLSPFEIDVSKEYIFSDSPSYIAVKVKKGEGTLILYAENRYVEGVFSYDDINSLKMYADILIGILVKMKLGERALIDSLTGVYTRWYILKQLEKEIYRYMRTGSPLSVLFIDVDDFKRINDNYGHDVGDKVLEYLGRTIKGQLRIVDLVGRYGGEEFLVILPDTDEEGAYTAAERIRSAIESQRVFPFSVTVSIGVVTLRDDALSPEELIRYADVAMYTAKKLGKNRTCVYKWKKQ